MAGSVIAATVAMFFSTFLNPYVATALTLRALLRPGRCARAAPCLVPLAAWIADPAGRPAFQLSLRLGGELDRGAIIAILEAALFWMLAAAVFNRRDMRSG